MRTLVAAACWSDGASRGGCGWCGGWRSGYVWSDISGGAVFGRHFLSFGEGIEGVCGCGKLKLKWFILEVWGLRVE